MAFGNTSLTESVNHDTRSRTCHLQQQQEEQQEEEMRQLRQLTEAAAH